MIPKRLTPFMWGDGQPAVTLLNVGRRGFDRGQLLKLAAAEAGKAKLQSALARLGEI